MQRIATGATAAFLRPLRRPGLEDPERSHGRRLRHLEMSGDLWHLTTWDNLLHINHLIYKVINVLYVCNIAITTYEYILQWIRMDILKHTNSGWDDPCLFASRLGQVSGIREEHLIAKNILELFGIYPVYPKSTIDERWLYTYMYMCQ